MSAIFKTVSWQVQQLISYVENGTISLPDLQRPFVWPKSKVRDLLDSMYRGYPVGELMFWDVSGDGDTRTISGASGVEAAHQIVDGQQRLTSLFASIKGRKVRNSDYQDKDITISFNPFTQKFEVWTPAQAKSPLWLENVATYFASPTRERRNFIKRYESALGALSDDENDQLEEVFTQLHDILKYQFEVVHIQKDVDKRTVADIFVRINSEGVSLKAYDYILTWLSVFWPEGREDLEAFARDSRMTAERASEIAGSQVTWTPKNHFINLEAGQLVRILVAVGQNRAKLIDAYNALQAKDRTTGAVDFDKQEDALNLLKNALPVVLDRLHWDEFIKCLPVAGFRSRKGITSTTNVISSYVVWILGRTRYGVPLDVLRVLIARWILMSQLTSRYTGSGESQLQKDLDRFGKLAPGDAAGYRQIVDDVVSNELTSDFWNYRMPDLLVTSGGAISPHYQAYLAALNVLDADMFMLNMKVRDWMDPTQTQQKGMEGHHLFPRAYQRDVLGIEDIKLVNQAANFAPTDWATNILISDAAPTEYWPNLVSQRGGDSSWLRKQHYWHALPENWESLSYDEFLTLRRRMMAQVTRDAFERIGAGHVTEIAAVSSADAQAAELTLEDLVKSGLLRPGDLLDPLDPQHVVDAVISSDGSILVDGTHEFDSLDDAAKYVGVSNVGGFEFWALETDDGLVPLTELAPV
ncbi:DUF262 domain-containing protein [Microbacterium sp. P02]|uniref:GmrSD restriction endonuclease domain-containing protein n=1 Tax=Microbacterium sp. P02 TaxID=3366260 RepID=UPI0036711E7F